MITSKNEPQSVGGGFLTPDVFFGLSTDDKPTAKVANGSTFKEIDTGKEYLFDYSGGEWHEAPSSGGGGGGDNGVFVVNFTPKPLSADQTLDDTVAALEAGRPIFMVYNELGNYTMCSFTFDGSGFQISANEIQDYGGDHDGALFINVLSWYKDDDEEVLEKSYFVFYCDDRSPLPDEDEP